MPQISVRIPQLGEGLQEALLVEFLKNPGDSINRDDPIYVTETDKATSMWHGWLFMTFVTMFCQAIGGIIVGFVIKYTGNIEKSFAVVAGLVITALLESIFNNQPFGLTGVFAVSLVATSTSSRLQMSRI